MQIIRRKCGSAYISRDCYMSAKGNKELTHRPYRHIVRNFLHSYRLHPSQQSPHDEILINVIQVYDTGHVTTCAVFILQVNI
jgi:hypothetical protein